ncbi:MAG: hypothetical protein R3C01_07065 [Planctomycetaceae bacterium]
MKTLGLRSLRSCFALLVVVPLATCGCGGETSTGTSTSAPGTEQPVGEVPVSGESVTTGETITEGTGGEPGTSPAPPETPQAPAIDISWEKIKDSAMVAEYVGQPVRLTGKVKLAGHVDFLGDFVQVHLSETGEADSLLGSQPMVRVIFDKSHPDVAKFRTLPIGLEWTVEGEFRRGQGGEQEWELFGARVVAEGEDPSIAVTAEELTKAFMDDSEAAKAKYDQVTLRLSGVVLRAPQRFGGYAAMTLQGSTNAAGEVTTVIAQFNPDFFFVYGSEPLTGNSLSSLLKYPEGEKVTVLARLQLSGDFGTGPDDHPGIPVMAWPAPQQ